MKYSKIYSVAYWEFSEKVRTKSFIVSLIITPLFMAAMGVLPTLFGMKESEHVKRFAVLDQTNSLAVEMEGVLGKKYMLENKKPMYEFTKLNSELTEDDALDNVKQQIFDEEISGIYVIPKDIVAQRQIQYYSTNVGNNIETERILSTLREVVTKEELYKKGVDTVGFAQINTRINSKLIKISKDGEEKETNFLQNFALGYAPALIVMILILTSSQLLVRSLLEEKNNRIMEILVSSCSPNELMFGKLSGLGALGIFQAFVWIMMMLIVILMTKSTFVDFATIPLFMLFGFSGFLFFASLMIGIGASVTTEQEAQNITGYIVMLAVVPILFILPIIQEPSGTTAQVLSYIPFTSAMVMSSRIMLQMPEWWEILLSLLSMYGAIFILLIISAKIFRVGVLAYGKRLTLPEILKLLKEK